MKKGMFFGVGLFLIALLIGVVCAEKLSIEIDNNYMPGETMDFKVVLYDKANNPIDGQLEFEIQNFYTDVVHKGRVRSGEVINFKLPNNAKGYWAVIAKYDNIEKKELFRVLELEKADIKLEEDRLIIKNIGNVPYRKSLLISIGEHKETAIVPLEVGQIKEIKLTAPTGVYDVRVNDGSEKEDIVFSGVSLTGNVIGIRSISGGSFWSRYPMVVIFLVVVFVLAIIVSVGRMRRSSSTVNLVNKNININQGY